MSEQKHDGKQKMSEKDWEEWSDRVSKAMMDFHPYDRELFEKMTREERKQYNNAFKLTGLVLLLCGILWFLLNTLLGDSRGLCLLMIISGICMLCYWNDPFCFSNLWKAIVKLFTM